MDQTANITGLGHIHLHEMLVTSWLSDNDDDWDRYDRDILHFQDPQQDFDNHDLDWNGDQHDQYANDQLRWSRS